MNGSVWILCRPAVAAALAPSGLPTVRAADPSEAAQRVREFRAQPDVAVVLVEEPLLAGLPAKPLPMLIPLPGPTWIERPPPEAFIVELLRRAIGYRVRLR